MAEIDPLLIRQLRRLGVEDLSAPPDAATWTKVLARISDHYRHISDDRNLLNRSLELSTEEMGTLHRELLLERDRLRSVVEAIGGALTIFHDAANSQPEPSQRFDVSGTITTARQRFTTKLGEILSLSSAEQEVPSSDSNGVIDDVHVQLVGLADRLVQLLHETAERASLKKQLEVARAVQQMLVPGEDVIDRPFLRVAGYFRPATECGGDWWTFHDLPGGRLLTVVGDVTGHGISSAIITGAAKAGCDLARTFAGQELTPSQLLQCMNCCIYEAGKQRFMMTCVACIVDPATRSLSMANAGHPFPYLVRSGGIRQLVSQGSPLGAASTAEYQSTTVELQSGDGICWFTDGLTECENDLREQFTDRRLRALFQGVAADAPEVARDAIVGVVSEFCGLRALDDDMTLVVGRVQ